MGQICIPPHLNCVATLPCEIQAVLQCSNKMRQFIAFSQPFSPPVSYAPMMLHNESKQVDRAERKLVDVVSS